VPYVGVEENFFDLGGHSLLLTRVQQRLERVLAVRVPLARMFEHPTVGALSRYLAGAPATEDAALREVADRMARRRADRAGRGGEPG
jgi:hypothetical protein